ncbi:hypothetical protein Acr_19g0004670 [Actinidia rufa]|uniref:Uncharacterized protein n=1 Tax=Actinidia rufa TaxID=165716 RepID=A0A7J0G9S4_9ERIC|nr:hypothetical protein Acr_19g0004670 [Actinidia rufa]
MMQVDPKDRGQALSVIYSKHVSSDVPIFHLPSSELSNRNLDQNLR